MHKSKDGKVTASLTEVKNKTGDIFALVDEFGEVILTSYNKPRYKIIKMDLSGMLDGAPSKEKKIASKVKEQPKIEATTAPEVTQPITITPTELQEETKQADAKTDFSDSTLEEMENALSTKADAQVAPVAEAKLFNKTIDITLWDRNSAPEKAVITKALKPLIS